MTRFATTAARAGVDADPGWDGVVAPISVAATYRRPDPETPGRFDYARTNTPTRAALEEAVAALDGAAGCVATASGMAAIDLVLNLLPANARVVCAHDAYGGTHRLLHARERQGRIRLALADCTDLDALRDALADGADLVMLETPSNPRLRITDIAAASRLAREAGALTCVDNTVLTPAHQTPLALGADFTASSATKLLNGHSDMIGGVTCARDPEHAAELAWWANATGVGAGAFDAFLALRGLRTLPVRARAQSEAALEIARRLAARADVTRVDHPGLAEHPGHALAARQQTGFGALLSVEVAGGAQRARAVFQRLALFTPAQSLGGAESLACLPALMTHASMSPEARARAGVGEGLIRLSVGLEDVEDLWGELDAALDATRALAA